MIKSIFKKFEYPVFTFVLFLVIFGLIVLYSASNVYSARIYDSKYYLFLKQAIICGVGVVLSIIISFIPYKVVLKFSKYIFIVSLVLILMTAFAGRISRGSSRWIELRGIIFQPSELMKISLIIYLAKILSKNYDKLDEKKIHTRLLFVSYLPTFIVALANLSTGIILFVIATFMIFVVSKKKMIFLVMLGIIVFGYIFAYPLSKLLANMGILKQYQLSRINAWKDPINYPDNAYQTLQGLYAIGSGKIFGRGYLNSIQKSIIPEAQNDMIFTILCEELGLVGAIMFLFIYFVLIFRIMYIAFKKTELSGKLMVFGIGVHIAIQVILNVGVVTNLLPNTGVTLPFISYGGSSLIVLFVEMGLVMSVVRYSE